MRVMRPNSIRARMTLAFSLAVALLLVLACSGVMWVSRQTAERNARSLLFSAASKIQQEVGAEDIREDSAELIREDSAELKEEERDLASENLALMLVDAQGHIWHKSRTRVPSWPSNPRDGWRITIVPFGQNTAVIGLYWVPIERALRSQATHLVLLSGVVLLFVSVGAWLLVGQSLSPIGRLTRQAQAASADDLNLRLSPSSQDAEIVELVGTLNSLLARLANAAAARGRFYAAASHELRTPLQALSGHLELALQRPRSEQEYAAIVNEAYTQTRRLTALVRDLLLLNRLEAGSATPKGEIALSDVCENILEALAPRIAERALQLCTDFPEDVVILAVPTHTEMLARNLLDNAVKYGSPGGSLRVQITVTGDMPCLSVFNTCDPLPDWDIHKLFEPFYRPDASRNSETGGNGLGLALCKAIADANGWQIAMKRMEDGVQCDVWFCLV